MSGTIVQPRLARHWLLIAAIIAVISSAAAAYTLLGRTAPPRPVASLELTGRVVDAADQIDAATEARLTARLEQLERTSGPQFVVATTPSLLGQPIELYSLNLANAWGIGDAKRHDGIVLLVAPHEHKVRIEVGKGLENVVTNALAQRVLIESVLPAFKQDHMVAGILGGADRLIAVLAAHPTISPRPRQIAP